MYVGVPVKKIKLNLKKATLAKGQTQKLVATVTPADAANKKWIGPAATRLWPAWTNMAR